MPLKQPIDQSMDHSLTETFQALSGHLVSLNDVFSPVVLAQPEAIALYGVMSSLVVAIMSKTIDFNHLRQVLKLIPLLTCQVAGADIDQMLADDCNDADARQIANELQADCFWMASVAYDMKLALRETERFPEANQTKENLRTCFLRRCSMTSLLYPEQAVDFPRHFGIDYHSP